MKTMFSEYLNEGSTGTAVDFLHSILCSFGLGELIIRNGEYGKVTVSAVKLLQMQLGFNKDDDVDGNFGPATRKRLNEQRNINVDIIPFSETRDEHNTWRGPETGDQDMTWDGEKAEPV